MELAMSILAVSYLKLRQNHSIMLVGATLRMLKGMLLVLSCVMAPFTRLLALGKRRQCPPVRDNLLLTPAVQLARKIRRKEMSSERVVSTYIERCKLVNPLVNAIVENRFESALKEAKEIDKYVATCGKTEEEIASETPLLGVPLTVKESIAVKGMSFAVGVKTDVSSRATEDADVVQRMRRAGAIPILVSNTPELCMCWETFNKVTGTTYNPYDNTKTAGGSSGGEAALLGSAASVISLSSDIGGSARLPAMFCGVFGHKPTPEFVSTAGHRPDCSDENWPQFFAIGPMTRYAVDLPVLLKTMCQSAKTAQRIDQKVDLKKLKFFYMEDDCGGKATYSPNREIKAAIGRLVSHIENTHGIPVRKAKFTDLKYSFEAATGLLLTLKGVDSVYSKESNPREWKSVSVEVLKYLCLMSPYTISNIIYGMIKKISERLPKSYYDKMEDINNSLRKQFQETLGDNGVLIYPTFVDSAHYPYELLSKICNVSYMMIFNSLGLPVTQCPMGLDKKGLPIGLQIVANAGNDHLTLAVAQEIERAFGGWQQPPSNEKIL